MQQLGKEDYSSCKFITSHENRLQTWTFRVEMTQAGSVHSTIYFCPCIFMNNPSRKLHFLAYIHLSYTLERRLLYSKVKYFFNCRPKSERKYKTAHLPVTWSTRIREVIMRPYWEKSCSSSFWVIVFGSPLTYKFASLIEAELGRA